MNALTNTRRRVGDMSKSSAPLVCLTAYTAYMARVVDPLVDIILVGDSVGMVLYGFPDTLSVTLDMMIAHGAAVVRSTSQAFIVVDMPVNTYEQSPEQALTNAQRVIKETGCGAVKMEGGVDLAPTIRHLTQNGIPVMGHIGLLPQSIEKMGGYKIQGRDEDSAQRLMADAKAISEAGAFAFVIEGTVEPVSRAITEAVKIPTIGIGASAACDGQVLVITDVLGLTPKPPRFAKAYAQLARTLAEAVQAYAEEVRSRRFPTVEHVFAKR
jgi:3-methyl-2-oxobutanoate hydroxymethyltransferase